MLTDADIETKPLYNALGIRLTSVPERKTVAVELQRETWALERVGGPTGNLGPRPVVMESGWSELGQTA